MRSRFIAPLLLLAALAAAPAAAQVEGSYRLDAINTQPLPAPSYAEPNVAVHGGSLTFGYDGRFTLSLSPRADGTGEQLAGTYEIGHDSLRFMPQGADPILSWWRRRGDTLVVFHDRDRYQWVREFVTTPSAEPWTPGTWQLVEVNGLPLPAKWPQGFSVIMHRLTYTFTARGRASIHMVGVSEESGEAIEEEDSARYRVIGDKLVFLDDEGEPNGESIWRIENGRLRMSDDMGNVYVLTRR
jgi:hypothetical protein